MKCRSCSQEIRAESKFCPLCGATQAVTTACPQCAAPVPAGKRFCAACGAAVEDSAAPETVPPSPPEEEDQTTQIMLGGTSEPETEPAPEAEPGHSVSAEFEPGIGRAPTPTEPEPPAPDPMSTAWKPSSLSDIPEEPFTEMFMESDWQPESPLSFALREGAGGEPPSPPQTPVDSAPEETAFAPLPDEPLPAEPPPDPYDLESQDPERTVIMSSSTARDFARELAAQKSIEVTLPPGQVPETANPMPEPPTEWSPETIRLSAPPADAPAPPSAAPRGGRLPLILGGVALVALIGGGLAWWLTGESEAPPPAPAVPVQPPAPQAIEPPPPPPVVAVPPEQAPPAPPLGDQPAAASPGAEPAATEPPPPPAPPPEPPAQADSPTPPPKAAAPEPKPVARPKPAPAPRERPKPAPKPERAPEPVAEPPPPPPAPAPAPEPVRPAVPDWLSRLRAELAVCEQQSFFARAICREKVRWSHCAPDHWDKVPECAVKNR